MKPIIILPPDAMSEANIKQLRENDLCVVVAKDPAVVKFVDPLPVITQRTKVENAAIALSRKILNHGFWGDNSTRKLMAETYVDILMNGTPLQSAPTQEELEKSTYDTTKLDEIRRLAREDARAERAAAKLKDNKK